MDAPQRRTAAFGRMETEKAMKEYTPSEKSTEELREYIAKLTEESEHIRRRSFKSAGSRAGLISRCSSTSPRGVCHTATGMNSRF